MGRAKNTGADSRVNTDFSTCVIAFNSEKLCIYMQVNLCIIIDSSSAF